jgi:hypothetical protein
MLYDLPVEIMASGNSDQDAKDRCEELQKAYLKLNKTASGAVNRYRWYHVPFFDPDRVGEQ